MPPSAAPTACFDTITSLAESPKAEGLIYAGSDDGLLQVTEDGGKTWRKTELGALPGVPATAFVNDVKADLFDADTVYVALDDHKSGDFKPYLLKSSDRGRSWTSIAGDLPARHLVWRVVQDHVKPNLLFAGTEFGLFFTQDGGARWVKLGGDVPTIAFRDLAIQRRECGLVGGSFGRGIFVLDDDQVGSPAGIARMIRFVISPSSILNRECTEARTTSHSLRMSSFKSSDPSPRMSTATS